MTTLAQQYEYQAEAAACGCEFIGMQERRNAEPMPLFNDPITRTTFTLNEGETVSQALERKRKQFKP